MQRTIALLSAAALCVSFAACSKKVEAPAVTQPPTETTQVTEAPKPQLTAADVAGSWVLDSQKNDLNSLRVLFGSSLAYGTSMSIGFDKSLTYSIGAGVGGTGVYAITADDTLEATLVSHAENKTEVVSFTPLRESTQLYLVQEIFGATLYWVHGDPPKVTEPVTQPTEAPEATVPAADPAAGTNYGAVLDLYNRALNEHWTREQCTSNQVNALISVVSDPTAVGYCLRDVSEDGIAELIIGACNEPQIYAMYTMNGNTPVQVIDAHERSACYLEPDNILVNRASNSAASGGYLFFRLQGTALHQREAILWDYSVDANAPYFYSTDTDWNTANDEKISNERAEKAIKAYETNFVALNYTPFSTMAVG